MFGLVSNTHRIQPSGEGLGKHVSHKINIEEIYTNKSSIKFKDLPKI